jgi:hypothetical protein
MSLGAPSSKYSVELVDSSANILAEISSRASQRQFTIVRNGADDIEWYMDIDDFENYCNTVNQDPKAVLISGSTEVRIKRLGTYISSGQLTFSNGVLQASGGNLIQLKAAGFFNLLTFRYTSDNQIYTNMDGSAIAWDLINTSQTGGNDETGYLNNTGTLDPTTGKYTGGLIPVANWDFGIRQGSLATVGLHNRTYQNMALSDALTDLCNAPVGSFDMRFMYDKTFNTYSQLGVQRPDIAFTYPGNIVTVGVSKDATSLANYIVAQGTGNGTLTQSEAVEYNLPSTGSYKVRQQYVSPSSLDEEDDSLQDYANWNLTQTQVPLILPAITVDGNMAPSVTDFSIGDWVRIDIFDHPLYGDIHGMYRAEQIQLSVDDNDDESYVITTSLN